MRGDEKRRNRRNKKCGMKGRQNMGGKDRDEERGGEERSQMSEEKEEQREDKKSKKVVEGKEEK